jgi:apolipoprotein N-acyltransferase
MLLADTGEKYMTNQKHTIVGTPQQDRFSYLWLALGILLYALVTFRWTIPLAAWLAPVFLLRFVRTQPLPRGFLLLLLAGVLVSEVELRGVLPFSGMFYYLAVFGAVAVGFLPYLLDRTLARRLGGLPGTLVFPLAVTAVSYLFALVNPSTGTWGNLAYTQYGDLPLMQLVSVTGLWGIDFLMSWFTSLVNWAWERGSAWPRVGGGAVLYSSLLALVLLFGGARLALFPAQGSTVRVAGITPSPALIAVANKQTSQNMEALMSGTETQAQRQLIRQASAPVFDELFALSQQEAHAGAKIILWPECSGSVTFLQEDEARLLARASALARTTGTYLDLGLCEMLTHPLPSRLMFDESILIDPQGIVVWRYQKAHPVPGEPFPPGDGKVTTVQTPYGRLSNVICFDADFPGTLRQAGQAGADIMLVPGNDWQEIDPYHTHMATFRAIENGYSLVRQTSNGLAMTVDYEGHVLGASDYFTSTPQVMVAYVPMQGVRTIYATIGDLFAWLSIAGLVVLIGVALARRRAAGETSTATPSGEPLPVS